MIHTSRVDWKINIPVYGVLKSWLVLLHTLPATFLFPRRYGHPPKDLQIIKFNTATAKYSLNSFPTTVIWRKFCHSNVRPIHIFLRFFLLTWQQISGNGAMSSHWITIIESSCFLLWSTKTSNFVNVELAQEVMIYIESFASFLTLFFFRFSFAY